MRFAGTEPSAGARGLLEDERPHVVDDDHAEYLARNKAAWEAWAPRHAARARRAWQETELRWGIWGLPESKVGFLRHLPLGADVIELGCGTGAILAQLARRGLRPVGLDIAKAQLESAHRFQREFNVRFPLVRENAEETHYEHASFDCVISEYGASLWCEPERWLTEASRITRPEGWLIFITNSPTLMTCTPDAGGVATDRLFRSHFDGERIEFDENGAVEFHATHGDWVRLLRENGFVLESLIETRPSEGAVPQFEFVTLEWATRWPSEDVWLARKTG